MAQFVQQFILRRLPDAIRHFALSRPLQFPEEPLQVGILGIHGVDQGQQQRPMVHPRLLRPKSLSQLRDIGQQHQRLEYNLLLLIAGVVVLVPERPELLLKDGDVLAVPGLREPGQVEVADRGHDVTLVGERGREVEQKAVAGKNRIDVLALGVFRVVIAQFTTPIPATLPNSTCRPDATGR